MSSDWIKHSKEYASKNGVPYKDALKDHSNAFTYYNAKAEKDNTWKKPYQQELCADMYSLHAIQKDSAGLSEKRRFVRESFKKS